MVVGVEDVVAAELEELVELTGFQKGDEFVEVALFALECNFKI